MIITKNGITIRMEVNTIRSAGRSTQGVKLINLEPGDEIGSIARLAREEDVEEAAESARQTTKGGKATGDGAKPNGADPYGSNPKRKN
jgi:DNA gyrase subunit A